MKEELTLEEQATNYQTMKHIRLVGRCLHIVAVELMRRADVHDQSKLERPEVEMFTELTSKLAMSTYGSPEYEAFRKAMGPALSHHYANNDHHPEYTRKDEKWLPVVGYEGFYEVSNYGDVRSVERLVPPTGSLGDMVRSARVLTQFVTPKGYCRLALSRDGASKNFMVHRLVAEAFIPNPDNKPEVNHKDGHKSNNRTSNLEWMTEGENLEHAYQTGLKKPSIKYVVECPELDIRTFGCDAMEKELRKRGYENARAAGIWRCINKGGKHLDLEFMGSRFETWMNSPINDMNLIQIIEMLCDWKASSTRHNDGNIRKSIEVNADRFGLSPQLVKILENTAAIFDGIK